MERNYILKITCHCCKKEYVIKVNESDHKEWLHGKYAQNTFPYLNAGERELLISKTCNTCFDAMFGGLEE